MTRWKNIVWVCVAALALSSLAASLAPPAIAQVRAAFVRDVDTPALQPFRSTVDIDFTGGTEQRLVTTVPAGKRLVIQNISYTAGTPTGTQLVFGGLRLAEFGTFTEFIKINPAHISPNPNFVLHDGSQPTTVYFEPGEPVWLSVATSSAAAGGSMRVTFSGYFVNL
jgi:hypothetical protein